MAGAGAVLVVEGLRCTYPDGREALRGLSFQIAAGEKVALLGPNGAGKSTLTLALVGVLACSGRVQLDELELTRATLPQLRARIGLVFQNPDDQLFCPTVREDVAFGLECRRTPAAEIQLQVEAALERVGLSGFGERAPQHLSGGEKKRAALATVLALQPQLLLVDEPTAGLDPRSRRNLIDVLQQSPLAMLVATHDLDLVDDLCPRALVLDEGEVVADASWSELRQQDELLRRHGLRA